MPYKHGWKWREKLDRSLLWDWWQGLEANPGPRIRAIQRTILDMGKLMDRLPPLAGPDGQGKPILNPRKGLLIFNSPKGRDYEAFYLTPEEDMAFVETGSSPESRRSHDLAAMVALTLLKWHAGEGVRILSDGNAKTWERATKLVFRELGYPVDPFLVLETEVYTFRDGAGKVFFVEGPRGRAQEAVLQEFLEMYRPLLGLREPFTPLSKKKGGKGERKPASSLHFL